MDELTRVDDWMKAIADTSSVFPAIIGTRFYTNDEAPQNPTYPLVLCQYQFAVDTVNLSQDRIFVQAEYRIKAIGKTTSYAAIQAIADEIDSLFQKKRGSVTGAIIYSSFRKFPIKLAAFDKGESFRHLGGQYRIIIKGS